MASIAQAISETSQPRYAPHQINDLNEETVVNEVEMSSNAVYSREVNHDATRGANALAKIWHSVKKRTRCFFTTNSFDAVIVTNHCLFFFNRFALTLDRRKRNVNHWSRQWSDRWNILLIQ